MSVNHGANLYQLSQKYGFSKDEFMDFSSNINPFGSSEKARNYISEHMDMVSMYPDPEYIELKQSISKYCGCNEDNIILGSGATELISSFIETVNPKSALLLSPAYSEYEKELKKINCSIDRYYAKEENNFKVDADDLINRVNSMNHSLIVICNPCNPTGFAFTSSEIKHISESTNAWIMVDETYVEFADKSIFSSASVTDSCNRLFVIRGTSKFFSTPGIRLGYGLSSDSGIKSSILKHIDLWNINIIASKMGEIMFVDDEFIDSTVKHMSSERDYLFSALSSIGSVKIYPSYGNFILCRIKDKSMTAAELREKLIPHKIIIRDCNSFDGLDEYYFRVCILKPEENRLLIKQLSEIL